MTAPGEFDLVWEWQAEIDLGPDQLFTRPVSVLQQGWTLERFRVEYSAIEFRDANTTSAAGYNAQFLVAVQWTQGDPAPQPEAPTQLIGTQPQDQVLWFELHPADVSGPLFANGPGIPQPRGGGRIDTKSRRRTDFSQGVVWLSVQVLASGQTSGGEFPNYFLSYRASRLARVPLV
ncbi:MAG: hypothetical protein ACRDHF_14090 [Tepidiformaceae bacterium]